MDSTQRVTNRDGKFSPTPWSAIMNADASQSSLAADSIATLFKSYRYPLYAFARRKGSSPEDAEDLTQQFFVQRIISGQLFKGVDQARGRFRTWLLNSFQNFMHNEWGKRSAQKRGGAVQHISIDLQDAEGRYVVEPVTDPTPDRFFDRAWAMTLLDNALESMRIAYERRDQGPLFAVLKQFLPGTGDTCDYTQAANQTGKSESAVKMAVSRFRQEYTRAIRNELARTVDSEAAAEEEFNYLRAVLCE